MRGVDALHLRPRVGKRVLKHLAWGLLGVAILAWIAARTGPAHGEVVVHVTEPDVEVSIGGRTFRIEASPQHVGKSSQIAS